MPFSTHFHSFTRIFYTLLTVGLQDCGGKHFHSFTDISYIDCRTAIAGIVTFSLISYILTVGLRDCGAWHFPSLTLILYTDCGSAGLRWQACFVFLSSYINCWTEVALRQFEYFTHIYTYFKKGCFSDVCFIDRSASCLLNLCLHFASYYRTCRTIVIH